MINYEILIVRPDLRDPGGVTAYFRSLENKFKIPTVSFIIGRRILEKSFFSKAFRIFRDYHSFVKYLKTDRYQVVHVNPSLDFKSVIRDGILVLLASIYGKKIVVFFHGWEKSFELFLRRYCLFLFKFLFNRSDAFIVLSKEFKIVLKEWGFAQPIYTEVASIDDKFNEGFNIENAIVSRQHSKKWRLLFLSRIIKEKGIYEIIETSLLLQKKYPMIELIIAGDGEELDNVKSFVDNHNISCITFVGYVGGKEKLKLLENSNVYCLPSYTEGMPLSVIEAMAFGLPVITRCVGGLKDFFKNGEHGFATLSKKPDVFMEFIERLIVDKELYKKISLNNYHYANSNFLASGIALRLENIYKTLLKN